MDLHGFDLNLLVALDALLRERSVTNAGRRVHLSQSAMSGALARLRHAFNDELLVSGRGGMTLTPLAESLVEPVAAILRHTQATLSAHVRFDPASSRRTFTIAASDYATAVLLGDALREMNAQAPHVTLVVLPLRDRLEELDELDIDLCILPQAVVLPARPHELLFRDTFTCLVWRDNTAVGDRLTVDQFLTLGHVVVSFADDCTTCEDNRLAPHTGLERRAEVVVPNFHALPSLIVGTNRIATVQTRLATKLAASHPVRVVGLPVLIPPLDEAMLWHPRFDRDPAHQWFRTLLKRVASAMPPVSSESREADSSTVRRGRFGAPRRR
jgi:LysR family transcriptional regulator, nod-box dependent transcriptional activator